VDVLTVAVLSLTIGALERQWSWVHTFSDDGVKIIMVMK
jgi:hypothetical protein